MRLDVERRGPWAHLRVCGHVPGAGDGWAFATEMPAAAALCGASAGPGGGPVSLRATPTSPRPTWNRLVPGSPRHVPVRQPPSQAGRAGLTVDTPAAGVGTLLHGIGLQVLGVRSSASPALAGLPPPSCSSWARTGTPAGGCHEGLADGSPAAAAQLWCGLRPNTVCTQRVPVRCHSGQPACLTFDPCEVPC